jgi:hypothetical protein
VCDVLSLFVVVALDILRSTPFAVPARPVGVFQCRCFNPHSDKWDPHHDMARPEVAEGEHGLPVWRVAVKL